MLRYNHSGRCVGALLISGMVLCIGHAQNAAPPSWPASQIAKGYVVFEHSTLEKLPPTFVPAPTAVADAVTCALAQGQSESVQIGVHAISDGIKDISIEVDSDLDVIVYHRISPDVRKKLIETDMSWLSWMPAEVYLQPGDTVAALAKDKSVNFWLTFRADAKASPGKHGGTIRFKVDGRPATEIDLTVDVRPFELAPPRIAFGMYYRADMLPARLGGWGIADEVAAKLFRDMAAHGQNSVSMSNAGNFSQLPPRGSVTKDVRLAQQAGLLHGDVPCMMVQSSIEANSPRPAGMTMPQLRAAADWLVAQHAEQGWPEMLVYGWDEPPYPAHGMGVPGLRASWLPLRELPIRLVTALNKSAAYGHGDVFDVWVVIGGEITPAMRAEAARMGARVWTYSYRIWREGFMPLRQRYYAGLYTWAHELGGNYVWAYSHGHHGHVWFEPDRTEPLPITAWEARRAGLDDYRYLQMVEDLAATATDSPVAEQAATWLAELRTRLLPVDPHLVQTGDPLALNEYESIRAAAARYIEQLGPAPASQPAPKSITALKDEAAAFRGKSVQQCIAGLNGSDAARRRAAAWALCEMQAAAAPAVNVLADALDDEQVRFPALRALEAIGAAAYPAAAEVASLLDHDDAFVRLGATYALAGMARSASWEADVMGYAPGQVPAHAAKLVPWLRRALNDRSTPVTVAASFGLFLCGEAAHPALAEAVAVFDDKQRVKRDSGTGREAALRVMAGAGPRSAAHGTIMQQLIKTCDDSKGRDMLVVLTLAAMGPAAADATTVLEKHATPENSHLATTHYALFCLRGDTKDLRAIAEIMFDDKRLYADRVDAARFLIAIGGKAALVADYVREHLPNMDVNLRFKYKLQASFFQRVEQELPALRLLQR